MLRLTLSATVTVALLLAGVLLLRESTQAAPASVVYNGQTYYKVTSTDPKMDSGNEVCASIGKRCMGFAQADNAVCKLFHPSAKSITSVNGSKYDFYCDGAPQKGLACEKMKNTCQNCPACNPNVTCGTQLQSMNQFREVYVRCAAPVIRKSSSSKRYSSLKKSSSSKKTSSRRSVSSKKSSSSQRVIYTPRTGSNMSGKPARTPAGIDARIGKHPGFKVCEFYQATKPGDPVRATKKLVTCGAFKAGDTFCVLSMQSTQAKAVKCEENGIIVCVLPCSAPGAQNLKMCAADINRPRGNNAPPIDYCMGAQPSPSRGTSQSSAKKSAGQLCVHGGDCQSGWCLGVVPGQVYKCSCIDPVTKWEGCRK